MSVVCPLNVTCGRDVKVCGKRKRADRPKYWQKSSSETDNYAFSRACMAFFMSTEVFLVNTLHARGVFGCTMPRLLLNKLIIGAVIGDLFFHPDGVDDVTQRLTLSLFSKQDKAANDDAAGHGQYLVEIKSISTRCESHRSQ